MQDKDNNLIVQIELGQILISDFYMQLLLNLMAYRCWGVWYRKYTKSLIFRDFDDAFKHPLGYVHLFLMLTLLSNNDFIPLTLTHISNFVQISLSINLTMQACLSTTSTSVISQPTISRTVVLI